MMNSPENTGDKVLILYGTKAYIRLVFGGRERVKKLPKLCYVIYN